MSANVRANILKNTFRINTQRSQSKAYVFLTDSMDRMQAATDPDVQTIYNNFLPYYSAYKNMYIAVLIAKGTLKGKTQLFEEMLKDLTPKLKEWEGQIFAVFPEDSPTEKEIFPNDRKPFYAGSYTNRLAALAALANKLLEYPALAATQADVASYHTMAETARLAQMGKMGDLDNLRSQRKDLWLSAITAYWGMVWGALLTRFYAEPERLNDYVDFSMLYGPYPEYFFEEIIVVEGLNVIPIPEPVAAKLNPNRMAVLVNDSLDAINLEVGFSALPDAPGPVVVSVPDGSRRTLNVGEAGWAPGRNFLVINNPTLYAGMFRLEIRQ